MKKLLLIVGLGLMLCGCCTTNSKPSPEWQVGFYAGAQYAYFYIYQDMKKIYNDKTLTVEQKKVKIHVLYERGVQKQWQKWLDFNTKRTQQE